MTRAGATAVAVGIALVAVACGTAPQPADAGSTEDVLASREALGAPLVAVAEAAIALAADLDAVRHEVGRGRELADAVELVEASVSALETAADDAREATDDAPIARGGELVSDAATRADEAVAAGRAEAAFLADAAAIDLDLERLSRAWDLPGSQTEQRKRLQALADEVADVRRRAGRLEPSPSGCPGMANRRRAWAETVEARTEKLAANATSAGGKVYDDLRAAYRREPLGEDPLRADAADRPCWQEASPVAAAADRLTEDVEALRTLLN